MAPKFLLLSMFLVFEIESCGADDLRDPKHTEFRRHQIMKDLTITSSARLDELFTYNKGREHEAFH